jgi:hypothetical protein
MKNLKKSLLIALSIISMQFQALAQFKTIIEEHFTNTLCSVCASRNPGLYQNLRAQQDVLHVAYHPSAPYSGCLLNQHNKTENDARPTYYGIFGGTPRIVINGVVQSASSNYGSAAIFNPFRNINTDVVLNITQTLVGDSVKSRIVVKKLTDKVLTNLKLHVLYIEDTLFYNAPNGENEHCDVFRKIVSGTSGMDIVLPTNLTDSVIILTATKLNTVWNKNIIYTLAIIQNTADKDILNAAKSTTNKTGTTGVKTLTDLGINVYPNPVADFINIELSNNQLTKVSLVNILGAEIIHKSITTSEKLDVSDLSKGIYFLSIENSIGKATQKKIIK